MSRTILNLPHQHIVILQELHSQIVLLPSTQASMICARIFSKMDGGERGEVIDLIANVLIAYNGNVHLLSSQ